MAGSPCPTPPADPVAAALRAALPGAASSPGGRVVVAYSGGLDSTVLLHATARAAGGVTALHVNHGLSGLSDAWEAQCAAVAAGLRVEFRARRVQVAAGGGVETRARAARYPLFAEALSGSADCLLLAHNRDDQIETVLLRLLQGRGGYGMPASRPLGHGRLLRPFLALPRRVLADYARRHDLTWVEDPANTDRSILRNRVRHVLLPALRGSGLADDALLGIGAASAAADRRLADRQGAALDGTPLPLQPLLERPAAEAVEVLRLWLAGAGRRTPPRRALADFVRQLRDGGADRQPRLDVDGGSLAPFAQRLHLVPPAPHLEAAYTLKLPGVLTLPHGALRASADVRGVCPQGPVRVRFRAGGERLPMAPGKRRVKDLLREARVPPWQRERWPLLYDDAGLLAVPGIAVRCRAAAPAAAPAAAGEAYVFHWNPHR